VASWPSQNLLSEGARYLTEKYARLITGFNIIIGNDATGNASTLFDDCRNKK
jgi:hypothetical protein